MQDTKIENLTLQLVCLQNVNLYFYLHYTSCNMVGKANTCTYLLQQQTKTQTIIYTVRNCNAVKNNIIIIYLLECRWSFHCFYKAP